jgi:hypothetical protein
MTKEQIYIRGCILAISNVQQKGSASFAVADEHGRTQVVSWSEIIDYLIKQYDKECEDK